MIQKKPEPKFSQKLGSINLGSTQSKRLTRKICWFFKRNSDSWWSPNTWTSPSFSCKTCCAGTCWTWPTWARTSGNLTWSRTWLKKHDRPWRSGCGLNTWCQIHPHFRIGSCSKQVSWKSWLWNLDCKITVITRDGLKFMITEVNTRKRESLYNTQKKYLILKNEQAYSCFWDNRC